ncbi:MAG TPA: aromatic ring-hydroxylating dioxygenase subunit alpha [Kofleriaceae bacterium]|jgi:Rieske 2Fe-2S family protein|nr:aromatic ring-hydroxylating dioxygenase subunit alpha [Kofleriaceae bacterium]
MTVAASLPATLPGRYYHDPAIYALEQDRIFSAMWVCAGRAEDAPGPGSFACATVAGESLILACDKAGERRAFYNICRHRGARLCSERRGHGASLRCPYHAWTYGLDGRLLGAPMLSQLVAHGFDPASAALAPVATEVWQGMLWVKLGAGARSVAEQHEPAIADRFHGDPVLARYHLAELRSGRTVEYDVAANWKLLIENFMECSHCGPMHPELCRVVPSFREGVGSFLQQGRGVELAPGIDAFSMSGHRARPPLPGLDGHQARQVHALVLLPNVLLLLVPDHVICFLLSPQAADRTHVRCDWLFAPDALSAPDFDPTDAVALFDTVNRQDWHVVELAQQSMSSRSWRGGVLAPSEHQIRAFNEFVVHQLGVGPA